jgi:hypothetical protein
LKRDKCIKDRGDKVEVNKLKWLHAAMIAAVALLCSCAVEKQKELPPVVRSSEAKSQASTAELRDLYKAAKSEFERRAIALRAIDQGTIRPGVPVSNADEIFGTRFAQASSPGVVLFADQISVSPDPEGRAEAVGYVGSYLDLTYDAKGIIQNYRISNLHKGFSGRTDGKEPVPVAELKQLYDRAKSETERRDVALRAIDDGVIQTFGPVKISTVDAIFSTHLASELPTKKHVTRNGIVDFSGNSSPGKNESGWFLAVEYDYSGKINSYYLTNIHP